MNSKTPLATEYAEDVTDLRTAQRIIAQLRSDIIRLVDEGTPNDGEYWVSLDAEHARILRVLFEKDKLVYDQDADLDIDEVFEQFVEDALDARWDMARTEEKGMRRLLRRITPSA
jgi:hypothetical protein